MNLRDLQYITTVAQLKNFGKAAEVCHVSQPAMSMQIQKLEAELGVQIFERSNKHVMITPVGADIRKLKPSKPLLNNTITHLLANFV
jgi:LysR family transcriptional regulator, hydrogen peroxide-inducible genes activator